VYSPCKVWLALCTPSPAAFGFGTLRPSGSPARSGTATFVGARAELEPPPARYSLKPEATIRYVLRDRVFNSRALAQYFEAPTLRLTGVPICSARLKPSSLSHPCPSR
jgi:hypothetical protein